MGKESMSRYKGEWYRGSENPKDLISEYVEPAAHEPDVSDLVAMVNNRDAEIYRLMKLAHNQVDELLVKGAEIEQLRARLVKLEKWETTNEPLFHVAIKERDTLLARVEELVEMNQIYLNTLETYEKERDPRDAEIERLTKLAHNRVDEFLVKGAEIEQLRAQVVKLEALLALKPKPVIDVYYLAVGTKQVYYTYESQAHVMVEFYDGKPVSAKVKTAEGWV